MGVLSAPFPVPVTQVSALSAHIGVEKAVSKDGECARVHSPKDGFA